MRKVAYTPGPADIVGLLFLLLYLWYIVEVIR